MVSCLLLSVVFAAIPDASAQVLVESPVSIAISIPKVNDAGAPKRLEAASWAVVQLLGEDTRHTSLGKSGEFATIETWTAPRWSAKLTAVERHELIAGLRRLWGDNLKIEPAPLSENAALAGPREPVMERHRAKLVAVRRAQDEMAAQFAVLSDPGAVFDNSPVKAVAAAAPLAEADQGKSFDETEPFQQAIHKAARAHEVDPNLIEAVILAESNGRTRLKSPAGARGLMQLTPPTARALGVKDAFNPVQNIDGGAKYLKELIDRFDGNTVLAVAAYNSGPNRDALDEGRIPSIRETVNYVTRVFHRYSQLTGTEMVEFTDRMNAKSIKWHQAESKRLERVWGPTPD